MKSWDEVSKEMQSKGVPLSAMGYCKIAFDFANDNINYMLKEVANALDFEIDKVSTINPKPDDLLILSVTGRFSEQAFYVLKKQMKIAFPNNKCMVVEGSLNLNVALKWTSDLPTQEGLYRLKTSEAQMSAEICNLGMDELYIQYLGLDGFHKLSDARKDIEWYGPIEPPKQMLSR